MKCVIKGVGVVAPGINDWQQAQLILRGEHKWSNTPLEKLHPALLPANERRRTTPLIKLALQAAEEAQRHSGIAAEKLASVFASSDGDTHIVDNLCNALTLPERPVSPTQFHNSVHNAAAGYWTLAAKAKRFSTSISAGHASFAAGLLEAMSYVTVEGAPVLMVAYDVALPESLEDFGINHEHFAAALVLAPQNEPGIGTLSSTTEATDDLVTLLPELDTLRQSNPAAEALLLLQALATGTAAIIAPAYLSNNTLPFMVTPCQ